MLTSARLPLMEVRTIIYCSSGFTVLRANERSCNRWRLSFELKSLWDLRTWKCRAAFDAQIKEHANANVKLQGYWFLRAERDRNDG
ncbi:hypothetical protein HYC85_023545 [Camellia sinensis]|uniref:Uncharacterized protein n=1 Tax=Camellia sinensis TaxID=4442 RepID=A0A7J7GIS2_CAMSI|nr:hypothetical protein HYC85_023545 [Camellia sinensis]